MRRVRSPNRNYERTVWGETKGDEAINYNKKKGKMWIGSLVMKVDSVKKKGNRGNYYHILLIFHVENQKML